MSPDCLLYYLITDYNVVAADSGTGLAFRNLANSFKDQKIAVKQGSTNVQMRSMYFRPYGSLDPKGTVNETIEFDGYTCKDKKEKLYMTGSDAFARSNITTNDSLASFSLEFWFKSTAVITSKAFLLTLQDTRDSKIYATIVYDN
jgi:hypothetical protein